MIDSEQIILEVSAAESLLSEAAHLAGDSLKSQNPAILQNNKDIEFLLNKAIARVFNIRIAVESIKPGNQEIQQLYNDEPVYDKIAKQPIVIKQKGDNDE